MTSDQKRVSLMLRQFVALPGDLQIIFIARAANAYASRIKIDAKRQARAAGSVTTRAR